MVYSFQPLAFVLFLAISGLTILISILAARKIRTASHYYVAGGGVKWFVNGIAFAGDYLSAASFLGIAGMIAFSGFDGFMYSIGFLAGWIVALLLIAEAFRRIGKYTLGDALVHRFKSRKIRLAAAISTLTVSVFYLIPQMVGAGSIIVPLLGLPYEVGVLVIGLVVILIVATAGMVSTTYVQFIKGFLLLVAAFGLTIGVLITSGLDPLSFLSNIISDPSIAMPKGNIISGETLMSPGLKFTNPLDFASLAMALLLGTAALPHILIRYYTVPSPSDARKSTVIAIIGIGIFYILTLFLGLGALYFGTIDPTNENLSAPLLAQFIGGEVFFAIISSIAFATILGTVAGLIMAASGAISHDIYTEYLRNDKQSNALRISKITAIGVGLIAIALGMFAKGQNVAFLVGLAFAIAASANLPAIVCVLFWKKTSEKGVVGGIITGLVSSILLIIVSPTMMGLNAIFPLNNPGIVSIPLGFAVTVITSIIESKKKSM